MAHSTVQKRRGSDVVALRGVMVEVASCEEFQKMVCSEHDTTCRERSVEMVISGSETSDALLCVQKMAIKRTATRSTMLCAAAVFVIDSGCVCLDNAKMTFVIDESNSLVRDQTN